MVLQRQPFSRVSITAMPWTQRVYLPSLLAHFNNINILCASSVHDFFGGEISFWVWRWILNNSYFSIFLIIIVSEVLGKDGMFSWCCNIVSSNFRIRGDNYSLVFGIKIWSVEYPSERKQNVKKISCFQLWGKFSAAKSSIMRNKTNKRDKSNKNNTNRNWNCS